MKQNHEIRFKCSQEEHEAIRKKAGLVGMTIKKYLLYLAINTQIEIKIVE